LFKKNRSIVSTVFISLVSLFPIISKKLWGAWYNYLATHDNSNSFSFMNYGFKDDRLISLSDEDEVNRLQIQLYEHTLNYENISNKTLLEIGSGRGGGLDYLSRSKQLKSLTGIDLSIEAINRSKTNYSSTLLNFMQGAADNLPFEDKSYDIVLNVESSHCYPDMKSFVTEAYRVLKDEGVFCLCDLRNEVGVMAIEKIFIECGFKIKQKNIITQNVLKALDTMSIDRLKIAGKLPVFLRKAFIDFSGIHSSTAYDLLKNNKLIYVSYQLMKD